MLMWIAEKKGFLADQKLNITFSMGHYARKGLESLLEGSVDCALLAETNIAYVGYINPKTPIKCIASVEKRIADSIIMRCAEGETPRPQDLEGKTIGFTPRTTSHSFLFKFLEAHNVSQKRIKLKPFNPPSMGDALIQGKVDAISTWHPYIHTTMHAMDDLGLPYVHFENNGLYISEIVLATTKPFLVKNRKKLAGLLKALKEADDFIVARREEATALLAQKIRISDTSHLWKTTKPHLEAIAPTYLDNIHILADWVRTHDTTYLGEPRPDYQDLIDTSIFLDTFGENPL